MGDRRGTPRWIPLPAKGLLIGLLLFFFGCAVELVKSHNGLYVHEADMPVPGGNVVIRVERRTAHAFLAEYHRALVILDGGKEVGRVPMSKDTGGRGLVRVDRMAPNQIRLVDDSDVYGVDLKAMRVARHSGRAGLSGGELLGSFDETDAPGRQFRFIAVTEQPLPRLRYGHMR